MLTCRDKRLTFLALFLFCLSFFVLNPLGVFWRELALQQNYMVTAARIDRVDSLPFELDRGLECRVSLRFTDHTGKEYWFPMARNITGACRPGNEMIQIQYQVDNPVNFQAMEGKFRRVFYTVIYTLFEAVALVTLFVLGALWRKEILGVTSSSVK